MSSAFNLSGLQTSVSTSVPEFFLNTVPAKFQWAREAFRADSIQQRTHHIVVGILILAVIVAIGVFRWRAIPQPKPNPNAIPEGDSSGGDDGKPKNEASSVNSTGGGSTAASPLPDPLSTPNPSEQDQQQTRREFLDVDLSAPFPGPQINQQRAGSTEAASIDDLAGASGGAPPPGGNDLSDPNRTQPSSQIADPLGDGQGGDQPSLVRGEDPALTLDGPSDSDERDDDSAPQAGCRLPEENAQPPAEAPGWLWTNASRLANSVRSNLRYYTGYGPQ